MSKIAIPLLAVAGLLATSAASHAQSFGIEIDDGPVYGYSDFRAYGPSYRGYSYGYRSASPVRRGYGPSYGYRVDEPVVERRGVGGGCGTFFYWNGDRCADARNK